MSGLPYNPPRTGPGGPGGGIGGPGGPGGGGPGGGGSCSSCGADALAVPLPSASGLYTAFGAGDSGGSVCGGELCKPGQYAPLPSTYANGYSPTAPAPGPSDLASPSGLWYTITEGAPDYLDCVPPSEVSWP